MLFFLVCQDESQQGICESILVQGDTQAFHIVALVE